MPTADTLAAQKTRKVLAAIERVGMLTMNEIVAKFGRFDGTTADVARNVREHVAAMVDARTLERRFSSDGTPLYCVRAVRA